MFDAALLISVLVFAGSFTLFMAVFFLVRTTEEQRHVIRKLRHGIAHEAEQEGVNLTLRERARKSFMEGMNYLGNRFKPKSGTQSSEIDKSLWHAGFRSKNAAKFFFGVKVFLACLLPSLVLLYQAYFYRISLALYLFPILFVAALFGFYLPDSYLYLKTSRRKARILEGFPDALDLMVVCVEAGMGLDTALNRVTEELRMSNKPLYEEFRQLTLELRAGKSRRDALKGLAERTDIDDVNSLVTLLIQTDRFGTSIAQALRVHSDSIRTKRHQRAEEVAAKLPVKLVFPLILFIFPSLFVAILGPALIQVFRLLTEWGGRSLPG